MSIQNIDLTRSAIICQVYAYVACYFPFHYMYRNSLNVGIYIRGHAFLLLLVVILFPTE